MKYTPENYRELPVIKNGFIHIDEDKLDIFSYKDFEVPDWKPTKKIKPYNQITFALFDIETTGLNPEVDRIMSIGLINEKGQIVIFDENREDIILLKFLAILERKQPDVIGHYNGFSFDLPFIIRRLEIHGINNPFWVRPNTKVHRQAILFNKSQEYNPIYYRGSAIIDFYNQVLAVDNVERRLTKRTLKAVALQWGLRAKARLDLSHEELRECYENWDTWGRERCREYLIYDLEDTKAIADRILPSIYYQQVFLDWSLQSLSASGNGSKWNSILEKYYGKNFIANQKLRFDGGLTGSIPGIYRNVIKIDVSSLYPSIMLLYGLYSYKDPDKFQLQVLKYMKGERIRLKKLGKSDKEAYALQATMKIMINSAYGALSTNFLPMNDYIAGALVTAYGRAILKHILKTAKKFGGTCVSWDTDGLYFSLDNLYHADEIFSKIQGEMPETIILELETKADIFFVPPSKNDETVGLKKNYIYIEDNKLKYNGKYRKRDRCELEKKFHPELLRIYYEKGRKEAFRYYNSTVSDIKMKIYPREKLSITRKIKSSEVTLPNLGIGKPGEEVTYVIGLERIGGRGKKYFQPTLGEYCPDFYVDILRRQFDQIRPYLV